MKTISGIVMFILLGSVCYAQQAVPAPAPAPAKVITEIASSDSMVKNAPFSADAVSESVQTLADGNRIVRSSTSKLYRNGEGRFRREMAGGSGGGALGSLFSVGNGVTIMDPVGGFRYMIDPNLKTARQVMITPQLRMITGMDEKVRTALKATTRAQVIHPPVDGAQLSEKIQAEVKAAVAAAPVAAVQAITGQVQAINGQIQVMTDALAPLAVVGMPHGIGAQHPKWETRTEELGTQNIEGVDAEGTRTITTIPAGAIGNERPIEITYEKWFSRELQLVVMSKHNDPRFGEQTYRLTNINRSEPDPSLFSVPNGYKLVTEPSGFTYTSAQRAVAAEKAATARAQAATISKTKP